MMWKKPRTNLWRILRRLSETRQNCVSTRIYVPRRVRRERGRKRCLVAAKRHSSILSGSVNECCDFLTHTVREMWAETKDARMSINVHDSNMRKLHVRDERTFRECEAKSNAVQHVDIAGVEEEGSDGGAGKRARKRSSSSPLRSTTAVRAREVADDTVHCCRRRGRILGRTAMTRVKTRRRPQRATLRRMAKRRRSLRSCRREISRQTRQNIV